MNQLGLPGGRADKAGNLYEDWWTALRVADLLTGKASAIRLEPPGRAGEGIEFEVDEPDGPWCEQAKDVPSQGEWSIVRVGKILKAVNGHLEVGKRVRLVLSTGCPKLEDLITRALAAETLAEFEEALTQKQPSEFASVIRNWTVDGKPVDEQTGHQYLRRVRVEHLRRDELRRMVSQTYERLFVGDAEMIVSSLRGYLGDHLERITPVQVRDHLIHLPGVRPRLLPGDQTTHLALDSTVKRFARRVTRTEPAFGLASQPQSAKLCDRLSATDGPQVVVCEGGAGSGKSTAVASVLAHMTGLGWPAAAVSMDRMDATVQTAKALGRRMDLADSPSVLLAGVADEGPALLVIDQLDAVSAYSGRMSDAYDAVEDVLEELTVAPNVKVLLAVRTVDIANDPRLSALVSDQGRVERLSLDILGETEVREVLTAAGADPDRMSAVTLQLLRTPLHLSVFSRLSPDARAVPFKTLQQLYDRYTTEVRRSIEQRLGTFDWGRITGALTTYFSDHEVLQAPASVLDAFSVHHVAAMESEAVLLRDADKIGFFHETYFDYLFARGFLNGGGDVHDFLASSGQYLFRRAQTRQILEYLAGTDRDRFRVTAARLLNSAKIRPHLHDVVIGVLGQLDAQPEDWQAVEEIAFSTAASANKLRGLLSQPQWFDAADHDQRWESWLRDTGRVDNVFGGLLTAARQRPQRVAELVRPFIATTPEWERRLQALVEWSLTPGLVDLAADLITAGQLDGARGPIAVNSDFWSILDSLDGKDPVGAARLVAAYLRRQTVRARAEGFEDPFLSECLPAHSPAAHKVLSGIAAVQPQAYVEAVLPFVIDVACARSAERQTPGGHWAYRFVGSRSADQSLFNNLDSALRALPSAAPEAAYAALRTLALPLAQEPEELRFLLCRLYTAIGRPDEAIDWLLSDERNLRLGWNGSQRWATRELVEAVTAQCGEPSLNRLTAVLLNHHPRWELPGKDRASWWGWSQYELLSAIPKSRRSPMVRNRLAQWERRFPGQSPRPPAPVTGGSVGSPIKPDAAMRMTDEHWRRAFAKYARSTHRPSFGRGGPLQLAEIVRGCAEKDPDRFCDLALTLDGDASAIYLDSIMTSVSAHITPDRWTALVTHADRVAGSHVAHTVCRVLQSMPSLFTPALERVLSRYVTAPDPQQDPTESGNGTSDDLLTAGMNSTRGQAALTLAALHPHAGHQDFLVEHTARLAEDPLLAVRTCAAEAVSTLIGTAADIALNAADRLLDHPNAAIHNATTTQRLLTQALPQSPDRFAPHLKRALDAQGITAELAGQTWAVAHLNCWSLPDIPCTPHELSTSARRGAAAVLSQHPDRSVFLADLFNDSDEETRTNASQALRYVFSLPTEQATDLIRAFMDSSAFSTNSEHLSFALHEHTGILPAVAIDVCERILRVGSNEIGDIRHRRAAEGHYLVSIVLRLYRQSPAPLRQRCLDLIDALSLSGAHGLLTALDAER
ncbi:hypothetical protein [Streptomyces mirabilis]|uniref:hypothetical protein n=1 Tax=Streptomyces mirabilis TaxID=68239 RepID=UPI00324FD5E0